jgi:hypothetical protein
MDEFGTRDTVFGQNKIVHDRLCIAALLLSISIVISSLPCQCPVSFSRFSELVMISSAKI